MRIDEAGEGGGHNDACLTKPLSKCSGSDEDNGKGQCESQCCPEAEGPATLRLAEILRERVASECRRSATHPARAATN